MSEQMTESQEHLAVRIKHRGQCPYEKGHVADAIWMTIIATFMVTNFLWLTLINIVPPDREKEAILRGYATIDPISRQFKWK